MNMRIKLVDVRQEIDEQLGRIFGSDAKDGHWFWNEYSSMTRGTKVVRGPHIAVYSKLRPDPTAKRMIYKLFSKLFADLKPRSIFPCKSINYSGKQVWQFTFDLDPKYA